VEWSQSGRDALLGDLRSFLDHGQWDDIAILLDDYFFALSFAAPEAVFDKASARRRTPAVVPARWLVIRANAAHLLKRPSVVEVVRLAADRIASTGAHDAAHEAMPEVRAAIDEHASVRDLAGALFISANTAKSHLRNLYRKLGATGREDALRRAGY